MLDSGLLWGNYLYGINMTKDIGNTTNPKYLRMLEAYDPYVDLDAAHHRAATGEIAMLESAHTHRTNIRLNFTDR